MEISGSDLFIFVTVIIILMFQFIILFRNFSSKGNDDSKLVEKIESRLDGYAAESRADQREFIKFISAELRESSRFIGEQLAQKLDELYKTQKIELGNFREVVTNLSNSMEKRQASLEERIEKSLSEMRKSNETKLEEMRMTVDEKLTSTLEKRLGESFKQVSDRLEQVHKGLGEMQNLASGVGDLKKVLSNVKTRGTWGEIQLKNLIEQILIPGQYEYNYEIIPGTGKRVELVIILPGPEENQKLFLPVDSKFPMEDFYKLNSDSLHNSEERAKLIKAIEQRIKFEAKTIQSKYIHNGVTTDFAIMFLPVEGFYAEVLSIPGLAETLQSEYRIVLSGPTTFAAILNSLRLGFRTLAIEKRSSEVWKLLGVVKSEFNKFGDILDKTQLKLDQASKSISDASRKTRTITKKLDKVEEYNIDRLKE
ncbi:MAG: DNA recombination protein RmuC [Melioribacteraceae bacterium]|nr:MAG: DNA recombination protein RmuC [Melioribacteraceae bacterium]